MRRQPLPLHLRLLRAHLPSLRLPGQALQIQTHDQTKGDLPRLSNRIFGQARGLLLRHLCQVQLVRILTPNLEATLPPQTPLVFPSCANCGKEYKRHKLIQEGPVLLCESCYELLALLEDDEEPSS